MPTTVQLFQRRIVWVNRSGTEEFTNAPPRAYRHPRLSPDGQRIAVAIDEQQMHVWVYDVIRETLSRLTTQGTINYNHFWTPDGRRIVFRGPAVAPILDSLHSRPTVVEDWSACAATTPFSVVGCRQSARTGLWSVAGCPEAS